MGFHDLVKLVLDFKFLRLFFIMSLQIVNLIDKTMKLIMVYNSRDNDRQMVNSKSTRLSSNLM